MQGYRPHGRGVSVLTALDIAGSVLRRAVRILWRRWRPLIDAVLPATFMIVPWSKWFRVFTNKC